MSDISSLKIGFIGAGQMARALAGGFAKQDIVPASSIFAADAKPAAVAGFCDAVEGAQGAATNVDLAAEADVLILAVKPQNVADVFAELRESTVSDAIANGEKLIVSIVAGLTVQRIAAELSTNRVVRVMPNTPCLIGHGMSAFACGGEALPSDGEFVEQLLSSVGAVVELEESKLDAVTGLSGSGPAFVYQTIEGMMSGGEQAGLAEPVARKLAIQTVLGAAMMLLESNESPQVLTDRVASPNGTTVAGLEVLADQRLKPAMTAAILAAARRSRELAAE